jgi:hypothetical protein
MRNQNFVSLSSIIIISQYNAADLFMLSDFRVLKTKLSVIEKYIATLGKPIRFYYTFVYVRDSLLLTPQGAKILKDIGKLSEKDGEFKKIEIASEDIIKLSNLLKRNR